MDLTTIQNDTAPSTAGASATPASISTTSKPSTYILDTGYFIRFTLSDPVFKNVDNILITTMDCINEIKDRESVEQTIKYILASGRVKIVEPPADLIKEVIFITKYTGDFASLSPTDIKIIALSYMYELKVNGKQYVRGPEYFASLKSTLAGEVQSKSNDQKKNENKLSNASGANKIPAANASIVKPGISWASIATKNAPPAPTPSTIPAQPVAKVEETKKQDKKKEVDHHGDEEEEEDYENDEDFDEDEFDDDDDEFDDEDGDDYYDEEDDEYGLDMDANDDDAIVDDLNNNHDGEQQQSYVGVEESLQHWPMLPSSEGPSAGKDERFESFDPKTFKEQAAKKAAKEKQEMDEMAEVQAALESARISQAATTAAKWNPSSSAKNSSRILSITSNALIIHDNIDEDKTNGSDKKKDNQDDQYEWATPTNYASSMAGWDTRKNPNNKKRNGTEDENKKDEEINKNPSVYCITGDYAIQNVLLQMRMAIISPIGGRVDRIRRWVLKCDGCYHICQKAVMRFCPQCGGHTLVRLAYSIDETGRVRYHLKKDRAINKRGTKYSIPENKKILLREDQLYSGKWNTQKKQSKSSLFGDMVTDTFGIPNKSKSKVKFGLGSKNPNAQKGRERRGKKKN